MQSTFEYAAEQARRLYFCRHTKKSNLNDGGMLFAKEVNHFLH